MELKGRTAVVTGGTQGLGLACAKALHGAGASIVLTARRAEVGERALAELGDQERAAFVPGDVTDAGDLERVIATAEARFGPVDILVNNVGGVVGNAMGPSVDVTPQTWLDMFSLNVHSAFFATQRVLPAMIERGWGRVIIMSSVEGKQGFAGQCAYVTAKHALVGMAKALSQEVGPVGVTVNTLCPGLCATATMTDMDALRVHSEKLGLEPEELIAVFADKTSIKRLIEPDEVGAMALFLCTAGASAITGAAISVDGGQSQY